MPTAAETVAHHNEIVRRAHARIASMEARMAAILEPILRQAGEEAAARFTRYATHRVTAAGNRPVSDSQPLLGAAPGVTSLSTMVAVKPRESEAARIARQADGALPADELHVTLAYLGEVDGGLEDVAVKLRAVAARHAPLEGVVAGVGSFQEGDGGSPVLAIPSVPGLVELRVDVTKALTEAGIDFSRSYGYVPHMTLAYQDDPDHDRDVLGEPLHFDELLLVRGDVQVIPMALTGAKPLTAAGPPKWDAPAADELVDVDHIVSQLRGKSDPVRRAMVESTMKATLGAHGIEWDTSNPFVSKMLAHSGEQITAIAHTTQLNVNRIISRSYEEGLSIPDTASAIREGMASAAGSRATLIARTEMVGAVNGGSLAATQIVAEETGISYVKEWLTGAGAQYPRHETYEGLNGQQAPLEGFFQVGGDELQFPGDPAGSPEEVCNCRCAIVYSEGDNVIAEEDAESGGGYSAEDLAAESEGDGGDDMDLAPVLPMGEGSTVERVDDVADATFADDAAAFIDKASSEEEQFVADIIKGYTGRGSLGVLRNDEGAIAGAVHFREMSDGRMFVEGVGSTVKGGGTALMRHVATTAADRGVGVALQPTEKSVGFYDRIGMKYDDGKNLYAWTAREARDFAQAGDALPPFSEVLRGVKLSDDPYVASLQRERYTTTNKINGLLAKEKRGTMTADDRGRLEALRKRQQDIRDIISKGANDPAAEKARVQNQINYMKRLVKSGTDTAETRVRLQLLEERRDELTGLMKTGTARDVASSAKKTLTQTAEQAAERDAKIAKQRVQYDSLAAQRAKELNPASATSVMQHIQERATGSVDLPPHTILVGASPYEMGPSVAWEHDGVVVKVELSERGAARDPRARDIAQVSRERINEMIDGVPPEMRGHLDMVTVARGNSPDDAHWQKQYKGFTHAAAQGGNREMWFWRGNSTVQRSSFDHEMGHLVGDADGGPKYEDDWRAAQMRDSQSSKRKFEMGSGFSKDGRHFQVGARGITSYGENATAEDWAESIRLWMVDKREGTMGIAAKNGVPVAVRFADVYPSRAKLIERWLAPPPG